MWDMLIYSGSVHLGLLMAFIAAVGLGRRCRGVIGAGSGLRSLAPQKPPSHGLGELLLLLIVKPYSSYLQLLCSPMGCWKGLSGVLQPKLVGLRELEAPPSFPVSRQLLCLELSSCSGAALLPFTGQFVPGGFPLLSSS